MSSETVKYTKLANCKMALESALTEYKEAAEEYGEGDDEMKDGITDCLYEAGFERFTIDVEE